MLMATREVVGPCCDAVMLEVLVSGSAFGPGSMSDPWTKKHLGGPVSVLGDRALAGPVLSAPALAISSRAKLNPRLLGGARTRSRPRLDTRPRRGPRGQQQMSRGCPQRWGPQSRRSLITMEPSIPIQQVRERRH